MDPVTVALDALFKLGEYLASLPEKDREKVKARMRAKFAEVLADIGTLDDEIAKTKAARDALPPPEPPK